MLYLYCYIIKEVQQWPLPPRFFKKNLQSKTSSNRTAANNLQKYHKQRNKKIIKTKTKTKKKKKTQERSTSIQTPASYTSSTTSATSSGLCSPARAREQWPARTGPSKVNDEQATSRCPSSTSSPQPEGRTVSRRGAARRHPRRVRANRPGNSALQRPWNGSRHPRASSPRRRTRETRERGSKMAVAQWRHLASLYLVHHRRPDGTTRRPVHFPWAQAYQVSPPDTVVPQDHLATSIPQVFTCFCADINQPIISFSRVCFVYRALYLFSLFGYFSLCICIVRFSSICFQFNTFNGTRIYGDPLLYDGWRECTHHRDLFHGGWRIWSRHIWYTKDGVFHFHILDFSLFVILFLYLSKLNICYENCFDFWCCIECVKELCMYYFMLALV